MDGSPGGVSYRVVGCPTGWSLYWYLDFCDDHLHRKTGYSNVLSQIEQSTRRAWKMKLWSEGPPTRILPFYEGFQCLDFYWPSNNSVCPSCITVSVHIQFTDIVHVYNNCKLDAGGFKPTQAFVLLHRPPPLLRLAITWQFGVHWVSAHILTKLTSYEYPLTLICLMYSFFSFFISIHLNFSHSLSVQFFFSLSCWISSFVIRTCNTFLI